MRYTTSQRSTNTHEQLFGTVYRTHPSPRTILNNRPCHPLQIVAANNQSAMNLHYSNNMIESTITIHNDGQQFTLASIPLETPLQIHMPYRRHTYAAASDGIQRHVSTTHNYRTVHFPFPQLLILAANKSIDYESPSTSKQAGTHIS